MDSNQNPTDFVQTYGYTNGKLTNWKIFVNGKMEQEIVVTYPNNFLINIDDDNDGQIDWFYNLDAKGNIIKSGSFSYDYDIKNNPLKDIKGFNSINMFIIFEFYSFIQNNNITRIFTESKNYYIFRYTYNSGNFPIFIEETDYSNNSNGATSFTTLTYY